MVYFIFNSSVATKEITILYKPDGTPDTDLKAFIEPLTTTSTSTTTTTPTTTTELKEGESCEDSRNSKKMHTWKLLDLTTTLCLGCERWSNKGACTHSRYKGFMSRNCKKSCKVC